MSKYTHGQRSLQATAAWLREAKIARKKLLGSGRFMGIRQRSARCLVSWATYGTRCNSYASCWRNRACFGLDPTARIDSLMLSGIVTALVDKAPFYLIDSNL